MIKGRKQMRWKYAWRRDWHRFIRTFDAPWYKRLLNLEHFIWWRLYIRRMQKLGRDNRTIKKAWWRG